MMDVEVVKFSLFIVRSIKDESKTTERIPKNPDINFAISERDMGKVKPKVHFSDTVLIRNSPKKNGELFFSSIPKIFMWDILKK